MKANAYNPSGYWEPQPVVALNDALLWDLQRYWGDPKPFDLADDLQRYDRAVTDAQTVLKEQFDLSSGFVVKDPRVSLTFPAWREAATRIGANPLALIALRNPISVCQSLRTRDGLEVAHAEKLWMNYTLEAERRSRGVPRAVVRYEDVLRDWQGTVTAAFGRLGQPVELLDQSQINRVNAFLDAGLNHSEARDEQLEADGSFTQSTKELYALLSQPDGLDQHKALDALRADWEAQWAESSKGRGPSSYALRFPDWHLRKSAQALQSGDIDAAIAACKAAIEVDPTLAQSHFRLAKLYCDQGKFQDALEPICTAVKTDETRVHFHMLHARILNRLERPEEALAQTKRALDCKSDWSEAHFLTGTLLLKLLRPKEAVLALEQAIACDPSKLHFHKALTRAQQLLGQKPKPDVARKADTHKDQLDQGLRFLQDKNWRAAHGIYAELAKDKDAALPVLQNLMTALVRLGLVQDAIAVLERMVVSDPTSARAQFLLGTQHALAGDWLAATAVRDAGLQLGLDEVSQFLEDPDRAEVKPNPYMAQALFAWQGAGFWYDKLMALDRGADGPLWPLGPQRPTIDTPRIHTVCDKNRPELSVMLPVYNVQNEAWLRGAIESVLGQTDPSDAVEIVVVDDASSNDVAREVAAEYGARVRYVRNATQAGLLPNHNRCLELSRGYFVHILHQDDWVRDGFYNALLTPLRADPNLVMAFCKAHIVDSYDIGVRVPVQLAERAGVLENWLPRIVHGQLINFPTVIARRSGYENVGGFTPSLTFAFDWEMWARLATAGDVWHDPDALAVYRNHAGSATQLFSARERMIDTFHTIAGLLPLLLKDQADQIGRHALHRVLVNGWGQLRQMDGQAAGLAEMIAFLHQGCISGTDTAKIMAIFD